MKYMLIVLSAFILSGCNNIQQDNKQAMGMDTIRTEHDAYIERASCTMKKGAKITFSVGGIASDLEFMKDGRLLLGGKQIYFDNKLNKNVYIVIDKDGHVVVGG